MRAYGYQRLCKVHWHLLLLYVCLIPVFLQAQNYPVRHFTMRDGLPSMAVRCVFKDSSNLIWIGTDAGLCTYDGKSLRIFSDSNEKTASQIWSIAADGQGNLWFGSHGDGLFKYNGKTFKRFTDKDGLKDNHIRVLLYSKKWNCLIVGSECGTTIVKDDVITASPEKMFNEEIGKCVTGLVDAGQYIYITTYGSQNPVRYYPDKNEYISMNDRGNRYPSYSFSGFISTKGDTAFSLVTHGIKIFGKNGIIQNDTLGQIFGITEDKKGDLWLAAWSYQNMQLGSGIYRYDGKSFKNYQNSFGIREKGIWSVYYDGDQEILWIGTETEGLFRVSSLAIRNFPADYFNLKDNKIRGLYIDVNNALWISGTRELIKMDPDGSYSLMDKFPMISAYRQFWNDPRQDGFPGMGTTMLTGMKIKAEELPRFLKSTAFNYYRVINDTDHSIIYSNELGLFHYDYLSQETKYLGDEGGHGDYANTADTLIIGGWGKTLVNPDYKISRFDHDVSRLITTEGLFYFTPDGDPLNVSRIVKHEGSLWYTSSLSGLWMSRGTHLVHFNDYDSTISNNLNDICFDQKGHVIFGSNTGGIYIGTFSENKLRIDYKISQDQGLRGNCVYWLVPDLRGRLWVGTNEGLNCVDLTELYATGKNIIYFLDEESGYSGESSKRAVLDSLGNLWIAADDQLIAVNTASIPGNQEMPGKIMLSGVEIDQKPADSVFNSGILKYSENDLAFHIDIRNYIDPGGDQFRYKLRGYDKDWHEWGRERKAVYTNLPPGKYVFCAEAYNQRTLQKAQSLESGFTIRHPWWGLWYIQILIAGLVLFISSRILFKYIENEKIKQKKESELEKKMFQLQYVSVANQFNPHLTFNLFNTVAGFLHSNQMEEAIRLINSYAQLLRRTMFNSRSFKITFDEELTAIRDLLEVEVNCAEGAFRYDIHTSPEHGAVELPRSLIFMFVENAIKHGARAQPENPQVQVKSSAEGSNLIIEVLDNGPGINVKQQSNSNGTGNGFKIVDEIIELYYKHSKHRIRYEFLPAADHSPQTFTTVKIWVPMDEDE